MACLVCMETKLWTEFVNVVSPDGSTVGCNNDA